MALHLIKLCVGVDSVADLSARIRARGDSVVHTRQTPKRAEEILGGGSLFWVIKGVISARQRVTAVDTVGEGKGARCLIRLEPAVVAVVPAGRRAFQGWRYLTAADAPVDLAANDPVATLPPKLAAELRALGAW